MLYLIQIVLLCKSIQSNIIIYFLLLFNIYARIMQNFLNNKFRKAAN